MAVRLPAGGHRVQPASSHPVPLVPGRAAGRRQWSLPGGRTLGILRQGATADRTGFAKRVWRLAQGPLPGAVLVIVPDEVRLRHARRLLARTPVPALLALEADAALAGPSHRIWRPPAVNAALDLNYALERLRPGGGIPEEEPSFQGRSFLMMVNTPPIALPSLLKPAERSAPWTCWRTGPGCPAGNWRRC